MARVSLRRTLFWLILVLGFAGAYFWWQHWPLTQPSAAAVAPAPPPAVLVHTAKVFQRDFPRQIIGLGTVQAWQSVTVRSRIDGELKSLGFTEGADVAAGQLLAQLDDRSQQALLAQAQAQQARDQAQLDNARQDLARYVELAKHAAIERKTLDNQRAQVNSLQASVKLAQALVRHAEVQLEDTRIYAPLAGRSGQVRVDPGNIIRANDAEGLVQIKQIDPIAVNFTVPDSAFAAIQAARASAAAISVHLLERGTDQELGAGSLVLVDNQINVDSATLLLKARLDNPAHLLWPGQSVDVRLVLGDYKDALLVPQAAVQRGAEGLYAYVVDDQDKVALQPITVKVYQDGLALIDSGLQAGQRVVTDGHYKLRPGVQIAEIGSQAADGGGA